MTTTTVVEGAIQTSSVEGAAGPTSDSPPLVPASDQAHDFGAGSEQNSPPKDTSLAPTANGVAIKLTTGTTELNGADAADAQIVSPGVSLAACLPSKDGVQESSPLPATAVDAASSGSPKSKDAPVTAFRRALHKLEAEYVHEVSELHSEIARLRKVLQDAQFDVSDPSCIFGSSGGSAALQLMCSHNGCNGSVSEEEKEVVDLFGDLGPIPNYLGDVSQHSYTGVLPSISSCDPSSPAFSTRTNGHTPRPREEAMLHVEMISASGLRSADWGIGASSDPYCICSIPDKPWAVCKTQVIERTVAPDWNHIDILCDYADGDDLVFTVRDKDWGETDDLLGTVTLPCSEFFPDGFEGELVLEEAGKGYNASINVKVNKFEVKDGAEGLLTTWREIPQQFIKPGSSRWSVLSSKCSFASRGNLGRTTISDISSKLPSRCMTKPDSQGRTLWDLLGILVLILDLVWIPMQVFEIEKNTAIQTLYWSKLLYWSADVVASFSTGYYSKDGRVIMRRRQVFYNYLKGWLCFDVFLISMDWIAVIQKFFVGSADGLSEGAGAARAGKLARVFRILRLLRLMRLAKLRQLLFTLQGLIDSEWMTIIFVVGKNLCTILALNHYVACLWFLIGSEFVGPDGWVTRYRYTKSPYGLQYLLSMHWSLSQFTPGKSPLSPGTYGERIYAISVLVLAMVVATCFVSSITSALGQIWSMNRYVATQSFLLKKFLNQNAISRSLGARVTRYIDGVIELRHTRVQASKVEYLGLLSGPLNVALQTELWLPRISSHPLFENAYEVNAVVVGQMCSSAISSSHFGKNDALFKEGVPADHMYFPISGSLAYRCFKDDKPLVLKLETNQWCTEAALWMPWLHRGQMKAVAHVLVCVVSATKFRELASSSEDIYKYCRGCAFKFWQSFDPKDESDVPRKFQTTVNDYGEGKAMNETQMRVRQAEDAELHMITFD